ncbi:hypothetical protein Poly51_02380 [Rubripirellula tenax]|uniref:Uncharacterized protein n=1 Tax=Rubripirellula tenax TaxID=2528015 RepID=A0A5C6FGJ1_9BACT|nr:hypothetical protein Poly51_02380 [Rubripirellula tenax]
MAKATVRQLGTRDLFALILIVALHFAFAKFFVSIREFGLTIVALALPLPLTALLQRRFQMTWVAASMMHYPLSLAWAFCFGVTYSMYYNRLTHDWYERDSVGLTEPIRFGVFSVEVMAVIGIATTALYAWSSHHICIRSARSTHADLSEQ